MIETGYRARVTLPPGETLPYGLVAGEQETPATKSAGYAPDERPLIVTRHQGVVDWLLSREGIVGEVIAHVTDPEQIRGRVVIGALPMHLAAQCKALGSIDLPLLPAEKRGKELTHQEMTAACARLTWYRVERL